MQQPKALEHVDQSQPTSPLVSVIIPVYNAANYIAEALDSVVAQTFKDYEILVVNDGSSDTEQLERVIEPYQSRIVYIKQENCGLSAARNTAIRRSRGSLIALLDADDIWLPNYLEVQVARMQADKTIDVLYPNAIFFGSAADEGREFMEVCPSEGEVTFEKLLTQECNVMVCVLMRREAILDAGLFDESLRSVEDFDLWLRIVYRGGRIAYHRQVLVRYRRRPGSLSSDPIWMYKNVLLVLAKARVTMNLSLLTRATLEREYNRFHARLRYYEGKRAFFHGDAESAIQGLTDANEFFRDRKASLTVWLLRLAPRLLLRIYELRDRIIFKMSTKY